MCYALIGLDAANNRLQDLENLPDSSAVGSLVSLSGMVDRSRSGLCMLLLGFSNLIEEEETRGYGE